MIADDETRFHIDKLEKELYELKEQQKKNTEVIRGLDILLSTTRDKVKDLETEIQILKDGGNI